MRLTIDKGLWWASWILISAGLWGSIEQIGIDIMSHRNPIFLIIAGLLCRIIWNQEKPNV